MKGSASSPMPTVKKQASTPSMATVDTFAYKKRAREAVSPDTTDNGDDERVLHISRARESKGASNGRDAIRPVTRKGPYASRWFGSRQAGERGSFKSTAAGTNS